MRVNVTDTLYVILHKTIICVFVRTSLSSHGVDGSDEQRTVGLRVLHEDDEQLQGSFHHQARLKQEKRVECLTSRWRRTTALRSEDSPNFPSACTATALSRCG